MTAVQFLIQSLQAAFPNEMYNMRDSNPELFNEKVEDAEEVFREQIETSFQEGKWNGWEAAKDLKDLMDSMDYYNQTYNK